MTVLNNPDSPFDVPYKGFQYPLPPSWKYAIRQQDQINYLLQAILAVDAASVALDELNTAVAAALGEGKAYTDMKVDDAVSRLLSDLQEIRDELAQIITGAYYTRNPVTGDFSPIYTALKQMYDILRVQAMTWNQLAETGKTWDELKASGVSWFDIDMRSNILFGDGNPQVKFTPADHIDEITPGYLLSGEYVTADTWGQMRTFGFLTKGA